MEKFERKKIKNLRRFLANLELDKPVVMKYEDSFGLCRMRTSVGVYNEMYRSTGEVVRVKKLGDLEMRLTKELRKQ